MAAITVPELVKEVGIAEKELDVKCPKEHLLSVSSFLDWRQAAPYLRLSEREINDIEVERKTEQEKRRKTLEMWSGKHGFKATYRKLVDALLASGEADDAEKVCRLLVKEPMSASSRSASISSGFASPGSHSISGFHGFQPRALGDGDGGGGGGGATDDTDVIHKQDRPKMPQLLRFPAAGKRDVVNIIEKISASYSDFGTFLLIDDEGTKVPVIAEENHHKPVDITKAILRDWLKGEGMTPVTWESLIRCLRYSRLSLLANDIEASLEP